MSSWVDSGLRPYSFSMWGLPRASCYGRAAQGFSIGVLNFTTLIYNKGSDCVSEPTAAPADFEDKVRAAEFCLCQDEKDRELFLVSENAESWPLNCHGIPKTLDLIHHWKWRGGTDSFFLFPFFSALRISFSLTWSPTFGLVIIVVISVSVVNASCYSKQPHIIAVQYTGSMWLTPVHLTRIFSSPGQLSPRWLRDSGSMSWGTLLSLGHLLARERTWVIPWCLSLLVKVAQSCLTLCDPMDFTVHGILQARILVWVAAPFSREPS